MSIPMLSIISGSERNEATLERSARQKVEDTAGNKFASLLRKPGVALETPVNGGYLAHAAIPAIFTEVSTPDPDEATSAATRAVGRSDEAAEAFLDFAQKSPAEKIRAMVLAEMGLTEDALKSLDPDARAEFEAKIRSRIEAKIRDNMERTSGVTLGQTAPGA